MKWKGEEHEKSGPLFYILAGRFFGGAGTMIARAVVSELAVYEPELYFWGVMASAATCLVGLFC